MSNFRIGQKVVCVDGDWRNLTTGRKTTGPSLGEVVTICAFSERGYLRLEEYAPEEEAYQPNAFRPIQPNLTKELAQKEVERLVEEVPDHVTKEQEV